MPTQEAGGGDFLHETNFPMDSVGVYKRFALPPAPVHSGASIIA